MKKKIADLQIASILLWVRVSSSDCKSKQSDSCKIENTFVNIHKKYFISFLQIL